MMVGHGIYVTATSSKAAAYALMATLGQKTFLRRDGQSDGNVQAVLVVKAIAGKVSRLLEPVNHLRQPPPGHDSVVGLSPGVFEEEEDEDIDPLDVYSALNYDELVLYDQRRVLPVGLILYTSRRSIGY